MQGLVFVDTLRLSFLQMVTLIGCMGVVLTYGRQSLVCVHGALVWAFWGVSLSRDTSLLFASANSLRQFPWRSFLSEFAFRDYVKLQPPFYTFWVSRYPSLPVHQIIQGTMMLMCGVLLFELYGEHAKYLISTPVYLLMSTQPGNDVMLLAMVLITLRLLQIRQPRLAAGVYGLTWMIKPLTVLTLPFMVWHLRGWILGSLAMWTGYVAWSLNYYFGIMQWKFFCQQTLLQRFLALFAGAGNI